MTDKKTGRGRPSIYSKDLALEICARIADGDSLRTICKDPAMPSKRTIMDWQRANSDFAGAIEQAREHRADTRIEEIADIVEQVKAGTIDHNAGRTAMDGLKFLASRENPRKYSDRISSEIAVKVGVHTEAHSDTQKWIDAVLGNDGPGNVVPLLPALSKKETAE
jgi:hypothetical protein